MDVVLLLLDPGDFVLVAIKDDTMKPPTFTSNCCPLPFHVKDIVIMV
jgi:hypothetical protein